MNAHADIKTQLAAYEAEHEKFEKGNAAAGTRARKALGYSVCFLFLIAIEKSRQ